MSAPGRRERVPASARRWALGAVALGALLSAALIAQDRRSVQRANRLYRAGDPVLAADLYARALASNDGEATTYNLGTALLRLDADSAESLLRRSAEAGERTTAQRGLYNLGYRFLVAAERRSDPDSTVTALRAAIGSNRAALRLDPADQHARWNLALAQRRLDALIPPGEETGRESGSDSDDEVPMNDPSLARSETASAESGPEPEDPEPADNTGERQGPREGAREAWATQDPGPITEAQALELLAGVSNEPAALVTGILWSHRPDIAWWTGQLYPGGNW